MAGSVAFVGRARELSSLRGALGADARMLLVVGDAGVGKTRFVWEGSAAERLLPHLEGGGPAPAAGRGLGGMVWVCGGGACLTRWRGDPGLAC